MAEKEERNVGGCGRFIDRTNVSLVKKAKP